LNFVRARMVCAVVLCLKERFFCLTRCACVVCARAMLIGPLPPPRLPPPTRSPVR
jgi:hypothetical protein